MPFTFPYTLVIKIAKYPTNFETFPHGGIVWIHKKLPFGNLKLLIAWADNYHLVDWSDSEFIPF